MKTLLMLLLALGLTGAAPLEDHKECQPHSRPWQVKLSGGGVSCSGALINEWWIVTSFSCNARPYETVASLGEHDLTVEEGTEQRIQLARVVQHSPYRSPLHSLTMVQLSAPARFNQYVQPIPLPTRCPQPGETCSVSGWGSTNPNQYEPMQNLKCLTVPVVDDQTCMNTFPEYVYWSYTMFCAGKNGTDNCLTDTSSVVVCDGQLQGVTWFNHGCENPANPTVYTEICKYNRWINEVMRSLTPTSPPFTETTMMPMATEEPPAPYQV